MHGAMLDQYSIPKNNNNIFQTLDTSPRHLRLCSSFRKYARRIFEPLNNSSRSSIRVCNLLKKLKSIISTMKKV